MSSREIEASMYMPDDGLPPRKPPHKMYGPSIWNQNGTFLPWSGPGAAAAPAAVAVAAAPAVAAAVAAAAAAAAPAAAAPAAAAGAGFYNNVHHRYPLKSYIQMPGPDVPPYNSFHPEGPWGSHVSRGIGYDHRRSWTSAGGKKRKNTIKQRKSRNGRKSRRH